MAGRQSCSPSARPPPESKNEGRQGSVLPHLWCFLVDASRCPNLEDVWMNGREAASLPPRRRSKSEGICFLAGWSPSYEGMEAGLVPRSADRQQLLRIRGKQPRGSEQGRQGSGPPSPQPEQRTRGKLLRGLEQGRQGSGPPSPPPRGGRPESESEGSCFPAGWPPSYEGREAGLLPGCPGSREGREAGLLAWPPERVLLRRIGPNFAPSTPSRAETAPSRDTESLRVASNNPATSLANTDHVWIY